MLFVLLYVLLVVALMATVIGSFVVDGGHRRRLTALEAAVDRLDKAVQTANEVAEEVALEVFGPDDPTAGDRAVPLTDRVTALEEGPLLARLMVAVAEEERRAHAAAAVWDAAMATGRDAMRAATAAHFAYTDDTDPGSTTHPDLQSEWFGAGSAALAIPDPARHNRTAELSLVYGEAVEAERTAWKALGGAGEADRGAARELFEAAAAHRASVSAELVAIMDVGEEAPADTDEAPGA